MRRGVGRARGALAALLVLAPAPLAAQDWNSPRADSIVALAVARRVQVDTTLRAWTARADGALEFLVELGNGSVLPPRVVKLEQLASLVRWERPGNAAQRIVGRRDTMFFPGDAGFYSDRYGVITNNLGDLIRLGDGRDVRDLPHPLSRAGRPGYEFAIADSLSLTVPGRRVEVYELLLRPIPADAPGMVGSLYIDRATGDVVRMAVLFTRKAVLDQRIERLTLLLENLLVDGQWWLPYRQEVDVSRVATWLDFPTRGIVRGRWVLRDHAAVADPSAPLPAPFPPGGRVLVSIPGNRILLAPTNERALHEWPDPITAALGEGELGVGAGDVAAVQRQAEGLVQAGVVDRVQRASLGGNGISDFFHVNRVEGAAVGLGGKLSLAPALYLHARAGFGFSDQEAKGRVELGRRLGARTTFGLYAERQYREAGDVQEVSGVRNTISAQAFADDNTNPFDTWGGGLHLASDLEHGHTLDGTLSVEHQAALEVHATPWSGSYRPTIPALELDAVRLNLLGTRALQGDPEGTRIAWTGGARVTVYRPEGAHDTRVSSRLAAGLVVQRGLGASLLHLETHAGGVVGRDVPQQELIRLGGMITGPGYVFHRFAGRVALSQRVELRVPVPFVPLPLLGYGRSPKQATLAPYAHLTCVGSPAATGEAFTETRGCFPSVGVAFSAVFDLLRVDLAWGLRDGGWRVGVDAGRIAWGVL